MKRGIRIMALTNEEIGQKIRKVRKRNNMTQVKFSDKMHMTQQMLSRYENGQTPIPNDVVETVAQEFSVPLSYFFGISTDKVSEEEWTLLEYYRKVDQRLKHRILDLVRVMAENYEKDSKS